jgi:DNA polymerase III subunit alpha
MTAEQFRSQFSKYSFPKLGYIKIPKIKIPEEDYAALNLASNADSKDYLLALAKRGFSEKLESGKIPIEKKDVYWKQAEFELGEINKLLFTDYILLVYHVIRYCRSNGILNGFARGSAGGSTLLYLIDVIGIDPIRHDLLFERFISAARTDTKEIDGETYISSESLPDVDIDSDCALKDKLNGFIDSTFPQRTCAIANYGTLQGKVAIKEVCKVFLGYSEEEAKQVSDLIEAKFGKVDSITKSLDENESFQRWVNKSPKNKEAVEIAAKLQGLLKNFSVHASGIIITNDPISETLPTQLTTSKNDVTSVDMGVAQLSGIKIDNLGLKNLSTINETLKMVGKKMADIDVNDPSIYQFINLKDQFYGVFQAEEGLGKQVLKSIKPTNIEDISVSIALGRPGSMEFVKDYVSYKETQHSELEGKYPKEIHYLIKPTGFVICFQEQIMAISRKMANFTPQESDKLRKVIGKKLVNEMPKWKEKFVSQSLANGYKKEQVEFVWEESFLPAANYSFNRSHSTGYAYLTAVTCYLKANHPLEYFVSMLKNCKNEQDPIGEISKIQSELHHFGIKLLPPHIILSDLDFKIENGNIRYGLGDIKGIAAKSMQKLLSFRDSKHSSKFEIFESAEKAKLNIGILSSLIQAGTLDDDLAKHKQSRSRLVLEAQVWRLLTTREKRMALHYAPNYGNDLLLVVLAFKEEKLKDDKGKEVLKDSRFETIKRDYERFKKIYLQNKSAEEFACWYYERKLLGFPYSSNLRQIFSKKNPKITGIADVVKAKPESKHLFVGIVDEIKSGISKGKGTRWFRMTLKDEYESYNVLLFNDKIDNCKEVNGELPKEEDVVIVEGTRKSDAVFADFVKIQEHKVYTKLSDLKENETPKTEAEQGTKA